MSEPIISISGLRGIIGTELTPLVAARFAAAFCSVAPPGPIILARDGRVSGPMLCDAIASTILASGRDCIDLDVASTPTAGRNVRQHKAAGGIQVSASHNPPPYNGMKLFGPDGRVLSAAPGQEVLKAYREQSASWSGVEGLGVRRRPENVHQDHLQAVLSTVDVERIREKKYKVLLDSNHGCGGVMGRELLERLGCEVVLLGEEPTGLFAHPPEPLAENLTDVSSRIEQGTFDVGFCQDPDADRLAMIDERGQYIGEELTAVICALRRLQITPGPVVTNCASSGLTKWLANEFSVPYHQSAVGEANVADVMIANKAVYGGEGSGGPIDPTVGFIRDSFVGMAQTLDLLSSSGKSLSQLVGELPKTYMIKDKMTLTKEKLAESIETLERELKCDSLSQLDGVRLDWNDRWLLLRASNTEPIVRLIAEAPSLAEAEQLISQAKEMMEC